MRTPAYASDCEGSWDGSSPASPLGYAADHPGWPPALPLHDPEASGPAEELVEALCSLPQLPTLPVTTVRSRPESLTLNVAHMLP